MKKNLSPIAAFMHSEQFINCVDSLGYKIDQKRFNQFLRSYYTPWFSYLRFDNQIDLGYGLWLKYDQSLALPVVFCIENKFGV